MLASFCTGAGLGATDDEAVEADGGREVTLFVGDLARPPSKEFQSILIVCTNMKP